LNGYDRYDYRLIFWDEDKILNRCQNDLSTDDIETYKTIKEFVLPLFCERKIGATNSRALLRMLADQAKFRPARISFFPVSEGGLRKLSFESKKYDLIPSGAFRRRVIVRPLKELADRVFEVELAQYYVWHTDILDSGTEFSIKSVNYDKIIGKGAML